MNRGIKLTVEKKGEDRFEERVRALEEEGKTNKEICLILDEEGFNPRLIIGRFGGAYMVAKREQKKAPRDIDKRISELRAEGTADREIVRILYTEGYSTHEMMKRHLPLRALRKFVHKNKVRCFFCGEDHKVALVNYHIVPKSLNLESSGETIILCRNCNAKLHHVIRPLVIALEEYRERIY